MQTDESRRPENYDRCVCNGGVVDEARRVNNVEGIGFPSWWLWLMCQSHESGHKHITREVTRLQ